MERRGQGLHTTELVRCQLGGELQQRQGVAASLGDDPVQDLGPGRGAQTCLEQGAGCVRVETGHVQLGEALRVEGPPGAVPGCEDQGHPVRTEPMGTEEKGSGRGGVQPVRVVDDAQHRVLLRRGGEDRQRGHPHQERLDRGALLLTERDPQGPRLRFGQSTAEPGDGTQQPVQRRERQRRLDLQTLGAQHGGVAGTCHELVEQRRLADTGLAAHDQRPRRPVPRPLDKRSQELPLRLATDHHATKRTPRRTPQRAIEPRPFDRGDQGRLT